MRVWSLGRENPLEKGTATRSSILAWRIPRTEEPGGLQSLRSHSRTLKQLSTHLVCEPNLSQAEVIIWLPPFSPVPAGPPDSLSLMLMTQNHLGYDLRCHLSCVRPRRVTLVHESVSFIRFQAVSFVCNTKDIYTLVQAVTTPHLDCWNGMTVFPSTVSLIPACLCLLPGKAPPISDFTLPLRSVTTSLCSHAHESHSNLSDELSGSPRL